MDPEQSLVDSAPAASAPDSGSTQQVDSPPEAAGLAPASPEDESAELLGLLPPDDGTEEIEWEGEKHRIPAKLKSALMAHADYTRKTQEVAEQRRAIDAHAAELQRVDEFRRENIRELALVTSIDNQLAEYEKVDWPTLIAQNPQQAMLLEQQRRDLQGKRAQVAQSLAHKEREGLEKQRQSTARRIEDNQRELAQRIKGWSPTLAKDLTDYGRNAGFPAEVLSPAAPVPFVDVLHKAMQWDRLMAQRSAKKPPAQPDKPVTRVGGGASPATKDPEKMPPDEWRQWREAQIAKKRKR